MIEACILHSLAKVYPDLPVDRLPAGALTDAVMLQNDVYSFQVVYRAADVVQCGIGVELGVTAADGNAADGNAAGGAAGSEVHAAGATLRRALTVRYVDFVPCDFPVYGNQLDVCEHPAPGLMPDILRPLPQTLWAYASSWRALWVTADGTAEDLTPGRYTVTVRLHDGHDGADCTLSLPLEILPARIPEPTMPVTNWFHCDGLCRYYHVPFDSEEFWRIAGNFMDAAVQNGITMLLTPVFTPPLDTQPGGERLTTQLVDVTVSDGAYTFDFAKLNRWIDVCLAHGVRYFEIAHFFTQWGCRYAPKVMGTQDGTYRRLFGWETEGSSPAYRHFLEELLPQLTAFLREKGVFERCFFHVSDEPNRDMMEDYRAGSEFLRRFLPKEQIIDALSDFEFYRQGLIDRPIVALDHIMPFVEAGVPHLWGYYCCGQVRTANRFVACPSSRNRILGQQLFKFNLQGFLQWAFNFYNSHLSMESVDPYGSCTALGWVPGGDPFVVYPGADGKPLSSLRLQVFADALRDQRVLQAIVDQGLRTREQLIAELGLETLTFTEFPLDPAVLLAVRARADRILAGGGKML